MALIHSITSATGTVIITNTVDPITGETNADLAVVPGSGGGDMVSAQVNGEVVITGATNLTSAAVGKWFVCSGTNYNFVLPAVTGLAGKFIGIRINPVATNLVTVKTSVTTEAIDGSTNRVLWANEVAVLKCDGTNWTKVAGKTIPMTAIAAPSANTSAASGDTAINLDVSVSDTTGTMVGGNIITIRRAGNYNTLTCVRFVVTTSSPRFAGGLWRTRDGVQTQWVTLAEQAGQNGGYPTIQCLVPLQHKVGDQLFLYAYQVTGGNQDVAGSGTTEQSWMAVSEIPNW